MTVRSNGKISKWKHTPNKGDSEDVVKIKRIAYKKWSHMLTRVQSETYQSNMQTYKLCSVAEDWLNFDNFYEDFLEIPFHWEKSYQFDKDLLLKGNKVYEKGKCSMIPARLNSLIFKPKSYMRDLPHGVTRCHYDSDFYVATVYVNGKNRCVARTKDLTEAFNAYKKAKEAYIKEVTNCYKGLIAEDTFNALYNWEVCFDD